jgi:membrane-bound serine protease (ClpP class)
MLGALLLAACAHADEPATPAVADPAAPASPTPVAVVRLEGKIDDYNRDAFEKRFNQAKAAGAKVVIVDLDSYGGLVTSGLDISRFLKNQRDVRTVAWVSDKAISAGAMIAIACDEIAMAPSAMLGDCAPISIRDDGHVETLGDTERAKSESPILAEFADSAARNGYDPLLAQSMVSMKIVVRWVEDAAGHRRFVDEPEYDRLMKDAAAGWREVREADVPIPIDSASTMLTVSGRTAAKLGLAKAGVHDSLASLTASRNYNVVATYAPSAGDRAVEVLTLPWVRMVLIVIFALCLYAAFHAPGHGIAEMCAMISLTILIGVPLLTGYAQWWEIGLILLGMALLALEIFVIPGFGVTGILGILFLVFGLVMTFVPKEPGTGVWPKLEGTWDSIRNGLAMVVTALACSMVLSMWLRRHLPKIPYFNRLILTTTTGNLGDETSPRHDSHVHLADYRPIPGAIGEALSELKPGGNAKFLDPITGEQRVFSVVSDVGYVASGTRLAVRSNGDNRIVVRPVANV